MFAHPSIHRGIFHSLVVALFFCFLATSLSYSVFDLKALFAWSIGCFILFCYILHLLFDELFRVDFLNTRLKTSFGTTLKIVDFNDARTSMMMAPATLQGVDYE